MLRSRRIVAISFTATAGRCGIGPPAARQRRRRIFHRIFHRFCLSPMPLPPSPIPRQRLHQRQVTYEGFMRDDGLVDIDAHLVDAKDHDYELLTGVRPAREAVHDMWARVTIDRRLRHSRDRRAHRFACPIRTPATASSPLYSRLIGANLLQGFRKRLHDDMEAFAVARTSPSSWARCPRPRCKRLQACNGKTSATASRSSSTTATRLETTTDTVRRYYPKWYRGPGPDRRNRRTPVRTAPHRRAASDPTTQEPA